MKSLNMIILDRFDGIDESVCEVSFRRCLSKSRSNFFSWFGNFIKVLNL